VNGRRGTTAAGLTALTPSDIELHIRVGINRILPISPCAIHGARWAFRDNPNGPLSTCTVALRMEPTPVALASAAYCEHMRKATSLLTDKE